MKGINYCASAKQAAEVDLLTSGKFRLGVGIGWNRVEYEALGQDFSTRGKRLEEQITLLRRAVDRAGRDVQRDLRPDHRGGPGADAGAAADPGVDRRSVAARLPPRRAACRRLVPADGPGPQLDEARRIVAEAAAEAGRDPASLGMEGRLRWQEDRDKLAAAMRQWQDADATHLSVNTMSAGLKTVDDHLAALATAAEAAKTISG